MFLFPSWLLSIPQVFIKYILCALSCARCYIKTNDSWMEERLLRRDSAWALKESRRYSWRKGRAFQERAPGEEGPGAGDGTRVERAPRSPVSLEPEGEARRVRGAAGRKAEEMRELGKCRKFSFLFLLRGGQEPLNQSDCFSRKLSAEGTIRRHRCLLRGIISCVCIIFQFLAIVFSTLSRIQV